MAYFTKVRLYYMDADNKRKIAPANTVVFDLPEDTATDALSRDYIREATEGEKAEARANMPEPKTPVAKKPVAKKSAAKKVAAAPTGDDTSAGGAGDDTSAGGNSNDDDDDDLA